MLEILQTDTKQGTVTPTEIADNILNIMGEKCLLPLSITHICWYKKHSCSSLLLLTARLHAQSKTLHEYKTTEAFSTGFKSVSGGGICPRDHIFYSIKSVFKWKAF